MTDQRLPLPTLGAVYRAVHFCSSHLLTDDALCGSNLIEQLCSTLQRLFVHLNLDDTAAVSKYPQRSIAVVRIYFHDRSQGYHTRRPVMGGSRDAANCHGERIRSCVRL